MEGTVAVYLGKTHLFGKTATTKFFYAYLIKNGAELYVQPACPGIRLNDLRQDYIKKSFPQFPTKE